LFPRTDEAAVDKPLAWVGAGMFRMKMPMAFISNVPNTMYIKRDQRGFAIGRFSFFEKKEKSD
jgi:hypothetical protein